MQEEPGIQEAMLNMHECIKLIYQSLARAKTNSNFKSVDSETRDPELTKYFFELAGIPTTGVPTIAITGSKGKGSTSLLSMAMLMNLGHRVGLVSSPHLVDFRERIRVNGKAIAETDLISIVNRLAPVIRKVDGDLPDNKFLGPTGIILAIASLFFGEQGVTAVVLEAGRGGRFDDNRIMENQVSCITPIMNEHLDKLGPSITDIALHKAGIIKPHSTVIIAPQAEVVESVLRSEAEFLNAQLYRVGEDLHFLQERLSKDEISVSASFPVFQLHRTFTLRTLALYQGMNVALAFGAVAALTRNQGYLTPTAAPCNLSQLRLPARCEIISSRPTVILDAAINRTSAMIFLDSVKDFIRHPLILVTALPHDKDYHGVIETLGTLADQVIVTRVNTKILYYSDNVVEVARMWSPSVFDEPESAEAFRLAEFHAGQEGSIWVVGTQSLIREALIYWRHTLEDLFENV